MIGLEVVGEVRADSTMVMAGALPSGRHGTSAVWSGTHAYIFGGWGGSDFDEIVEYDPATDTAMAVAALPNARHGTSAVWDGTHAYVFVGGPTTNEIVRFDPATKTATKVAGLPTARAATSAVWDGTYAYIFGGTDTSGKLNEIVRYDPATDTVTTMSATLPTARYRTSAVWDGSYAYVFGGEEDGSSYLDEIVRYDPATDTVTIMNAALPTDRYQTSAVWDGTDAYVFGGSNSVPALLKDIVRYNPFLVEPAARPPPVPAGWSEEVVLSQRVPVVTPAQDVLHVTGEDHDGFYLVNVSVAGTPLPTIAAFTGGAVTQDAEAELLLPQQATAEVTVSYRHDPSQVTSLVFVGAPPPPCNGVETPVNPFNPEWIASDGSDSTLIIELRLDANGPVTHQFVIIPLAGQAGAVVP